MDALPESIRSSTVLSGNDLARLAYLEAMPDRLTGYVLPDGIHDAQSAHASAKKMISDGRIDEAWQVLLHAHAIQQ